MRALTALWGGWAMVQAVTLGALMGTLLVAPFAALGPGRRERYTIVGASWWAWIVLRTVILARPRVTGSFGADRGGALVVCNHRSWVDPILLLAVLRANGLSKAEIGRIPFIGWFGRLTGAVFFDRQSPSERARARGQVMALLKAGLRVQLYPEGTRSRDRSVREKVFLALVEDCYAEGLPVLPCAVSGTEDALPPTYFALIPFQIVRLDIGVALQPADYPDAQAFSAAVWDDVKARVQRLDEGSATRA